MIRINWVRAVFCIWGVTQVFSQPVLAEIAFPEPVPIQLVSPNRRQFVKQLEPSANRTQKKIPSQIQLFGYADEADLFLMYADGLIINPFDQTRGWIPLMPSERRQVVNYLIEAADRYQIEGDTQTVRRLARYIRLIDPAQLDFVNLEFLAQLDRLEAEETTITDILDWVISQFPVQFHASPGYQKFWAQAMLKLDVYRKQENQEQALEWIRKLRRLEPNHPFLIKTAGEIAIEYNDLKGLGRLHDRLRVTLRSSKRMDIEWHWGQLLIEKAKSLSALGHINLANQLLYEAIVYQPLSSEPRYLLSRYYEDLGLTIQALDILTVSPRIPDENWDGYAVNLSKKSLSLAAYLVSSNQVDEGLKICEQSEYFLANDAHLYQVMGTAYLKKKWVNQAIVAFQKAVHIGQDAQSSKMLRELSEHAFKAGVKKYKQKKRYAAKKSFERSINIDPTFAMAYFWLGKTHERLGNPRLAKQSYLRVQRLEPDYPGVKKKLSQLGG